MALASNLGSGSSAAKQLVTFDIDGTLIHSAGPLANRFHKRAFSHAFFEVFGIQDGTIDVVQHHGTTDPIALVRTLEFYGIPKEDAIAKLPELKASMVDYAKTHVADAGDGLQLLPGVSELLKTLSSKDDFLVGLVTGNLEDIAWMKMSSLGIESYFSVPHIGGQFFYFDFFFFFNSISSFGSDHENRGELVKLALQRARERFNVEILMHAHVGDTPSDMIAAGFGGAIPVGVCTGVFTRSDLLEASGSNSRTVILNDLTNAEEFLSIFDRA